MWYLNLFASLVSVITLDLILYTTNKCGPKAMFITWLPGRLITIVFTQFGNPELQDWLKLTWASFSISITFLAVFHFSLQYIQTKRRSRFSWAHKQWITCWIVAILISIGCMVLCFSVENEYILFAMGMGAAYVNIVNVLDAPVHLHTEKTTYSVCYFVTLDIAVFAILMIINTLIDFGYTKWAAIGGSIPILAIAMLVNSTCSNSEEAAKNTLQHIYLLAYQTWPAMAAIGVLWGAKRLGDIPALVLSAIACIVVIALQYMIVRIRL